MQSHGIRIAASSSTMKNVVHIIVSTILLASSCQPASVRENENEMFVVNELFLLRTEGLALYQIAMSANPTADVQSACENLKNYYATTQEEFIYLCDGRSIAIGAEDYDVIWRHVEGQLLKDSAQFETAFIELSTDNLLRSIALHELILQRQDWEDIMYYAFKSLPELYKQQGVLQQLKESRYTRKSPETMEIETAQLTL